MMRILSAAEAAELMRCSVKTIEERARSGDLPGLLWGDGGWVFPDEAFYARVNELAVAQAKMRRAPVNSTAVFVPQPTRGKTPPQLPRMAVVTRETAHGRDN